MDSNPLRRTGAFLLSAGTPAEAGSNLPLAKRTSQMGNLFYFYKK
jgi:hypothetical protein